MIQVATVMWGTKYSTNYINEMYKAIVDNASCDIHFVCITDRDPKEFDENIIIKKFPEFRLPFEKMKEGCRLKLSIFKEGILDPDLPTVFFDIDSLICGDVKIFADILAKTRGIYMYPNHMIPLYLYINRVININKYYFCNGSFVLFYPCDFTNLIPEFEKQIHESYKNNPDIDHFSLPKHIRSDERFVSWYAKDRIHIISKRYAGKFTRKFMEKSLLLFIIKNKLLNSYAKKQTIAITFDGDELKPENIVAFKKNQVILANKKYKCLWIYDWIQKYWVNFLNK
ncbi:hypothetical protein ACFPDQ_07655 [Pseudofrancisella aestuarii]|uniref:Glycosyl transferase n=1 Tax=Pseudofrancisella aestuarii TaxID=2670347 RepID=A0ABV9TCM2_9GAMM|nr:hypothetical protein [Pseudofrancisella aestuarii]